MSEGTLITKYEHIKEIIKTIDTYFKEHYSFFKIVTTDKSIMIIPNISRKSIDQKVLTRTYNTLINSILDNYKTQIEESTPYKIHLRKNKLTITC